jgi:hypothetical protein
MHIRKWQAPVAALGALVLALGLGSAPAGATPTATLTTAHIASGSRPSGGAAGFNFDASSAYYICDNDGDGYCIQSTSLDDQAFTWTPAQQFEAGDVGVVLGDCNSTGGDVWPFTSGTGFNNLYCGDHVGYLTTANGDCLGLYNPGGTMQTILRACGNSITVMWVAVGYWLVNVQATDIQDNYPFGSAMKAGCFGDCRIWIQADQPGNDTDQWASVTG